MIRRNTVFVVGAGASVPYGFPSGAELMRRFKEHTAKSFVAYLGDPRWSTEVAAGMLYTLQHAQDDSLDAVLEHVMPPDIKSDRRHPLEFLGCQYIAASILEAERDYQLKHKSRSDWLQYFWRLLIGDAGSLGEVLSKAKITFITFNYDRLIEQCLWWGMGARFMHEARKLREEFFRRIAVIHLHGSLGPIFGDWNDTVPFGLLDPLGNPIGDDDRLKRLESATCSIRIIHEVPELTEEFKAAHTALREADLVVFLGFGFGSKNVQRLGLDNINPAATVLFTCMSKTAQERKLEIQLPFARAGRKGLHDTLHDRNCHQLLAEHVLQIVTR